MEARGVSPGNFPVPPLEGLQASVGDKHGNNCNKQSQKDKGRDVMDR